MNTILEFLGAKWKEYAIIAGASLVLSIGLYVKGYMAGRAAVENSELKQTVKVVHDVKIIHDKVNALSDPDVANGLLRWTRP